VIGATTELAGAVIASGALVVDTNVKKVQHPTGGIVGELLVRDGSQVRAGDLLLRLDETTAQANVAMVDKRGPRKIGATHPTPQNCRQMIPLCSRFDSLAFTPGSHAIGIESNFSRCPEV
jgi:hypothetical protein